MGNKSTDWCPYRKDTETHRGEGDVMMEAGIGVMQVQARDCW